MKKLPSIVRLPKHRRFGFEPRYYDPVKEEIEIRTAEIRSQLQAKEGERQPLLPRGSMADGFRRRQQQKMNSGLLVIGLVAILCAITYGFFTYADAFASLFGQ